MRFILQKELKSFFCTSTGYVIIGLFLLFTALFLWILPGQINVLDSGYASINGLFDITPWLFLFLCPAISMKFFTEEKNIGTIELLLTKPITKTQIVLGKTFAGWILVAISLLPSVFWYLSICILSEPMGNVDSGTFWGSLMGLLLLALLYISVGVFSSTISSNQVVSFLAASIISFVIFYGFDLLGSLCSGKLAYFLKSFGVHEHYISISRGVIDSRDIIYFLFISVIFQLLSVNQLKRK